jgi:hypothetical protein
MINLTENISTPTAQSDTIYTPLSFFHTFNNSISIELEKHLIEAEGVFLAGEGKEYKGFFFDNLRDENGCQMISLKVSSSHRSYLTNGSSIKVRGFLTRRVDEKKMEIQIIFNVTDVLGK